MRPGVGEPLFQIGQKWLGIPFVRGCHIRTLTPARRERRHTARQLHQVGNFQRRYALTPPPQRAHRHQRLTQSGIHHQRIIALCRALLRYPSGLLLFKQVLLCFIICYRHLIQRILHDIFSSAAINQAGPPVLLLTPASASLYHQDDDTRDRDSFDVYSHLQRSSPPTDSQHPSPPESLLLLYARPCRQDTQKYALHVPTAVPILTYTPSPPDGVLAHRADMIK